MSSGALPQGLPAAGLARRLAALFYDSLLMLAAGWGVTALYIMIRVSVVGEQTIRDNQEIAASGPLLQMLLIATIVGFCCIFWMRNGQTLGMQSWRLRLERVDDGSLTLLDCFKRCAAALLSFACFGCGYWWAIVDREKRSWHDRLSGTRVVLLPKTPKK